MGRTQGNSKRIRQLRKTYPAWSVDVTKGGHIRLTHTKTGRVLFTSRTPSDWRADRNFQSQVRRAEREIANTE